MIYCCSIIIKVELINSWNFGVLTDEFVYV